MEVFRSNTSDEYYFPPRYCGTTRGELGRIMESYDHFLLARYYGITIDDFGRSAESYEY